ncbi:glucokinase or N-acetyl-D-glucosamine kinase, putative [Psychroflexus torquis ATCC 700755]|uniref:Glucokinase or N-acetyl-D-glucosamine kinase, putative n=1 Tax=Psychroflexus torquis (strain ATCC 700755 / CIP 106069 / ACAM 623) TaxID=313595 RepID=K4IJZ9_PSYTT|nr:BadF/BadG/BcrA/BcrD ATPase family protein [Psychroflexus torquis]AFU70133.1 glucokinase or N-acetyl-D-glucosamine kinase, putative [Psychroflexus torquis ATCC 700755]
MILIADGGSTKCDWILLDDEGEVVTKTRTKGLNPAVFKPDILKSRLQENDALKQIIPKVSRVDFYGAGCGTPTPIKNLKGILEDYFNNAEVNVEEDMVAAALAATTERGIVCILGTGSNSCFFDGKKVHMEVESLGYVLMDEASGNYFGKRLIRDYYYKTMGKDMSKEFAKRYDLSADSIKRNVYKEDNPNTYLASFAEFIFTAQERNGYFYKLIYEGMEKFIERRVMCYKQAQNVPIHFIGSIAFFSEDIIRDVAKRYHLNIGNVIRRPIDGLISHYKKNVLKVK